ncbi:uncharacterized protein LOC113364051 isoform X2 [Ctenocephalides felis]|uniref:uncharacterized protein LOC113364051 isoform X2 n=1 Tax=Ctenocephalides felis TaxID=7515 RepID=UPI000E6E133A|nr:uncharacterized protein LOC113364051 isoform X2 [Ctenocephalides felis]
MDIKNNVNMELRQKTKVLQDNSNVEDKIDKLFEELENKPVETTGTKSKTPAASKKRKQPPSVLKKPVKKPSLEPIPSTSYTFKKTIINKLSKGSSAKKFYCISCHNFTEYYTINEPRTCPICKYKTHHNGDSEDSDDSTYYQTLKDLLKRKRESAKNKENISSKEKEVSADANGHCDKNGHCDNGKENCNQSICS